MRVVHVTNYFMPRIGYQDHYLAKFQAEAGHDVHVITSDRAYPIQADQAVFGSVFPSRRLPVGIERRDGYTVHRLHGYLERNMQLFLRGVLGELRSLAPEIVIAHGFSRFETARIAAYKRLSRSSFRLVVDDHTFRSAYHPRLYRRAYYALFRGVYRLVSPAIDEIVPVTSETRDFLADMFHVPPASMKIVPLGADCDLFTFDADSGRRLRRRLGISDDAVVIVYAGKVTAEKGVHLLCSAARSILQEGPGCRLLIVGTGVESEYARSIQAELAAEGVGAQVIWHDHVPHDSLPAVFSAADIAAWPHQETMAALEAAACGRPIILRDSTVGREWTARGNGFTFTSNEDFEAALARLIAQPELRRTMGQRGARFVRERFDWRVIAESFTELGSNTSPSPA
jgi:glycosyltransferase involved in cell wall biosynthesis